MTSLKRRMRLAARRLGWDMQRYPQSDVLWRVASLLRTADVGLVLDVGASDGGYGSGIRRHGYEQRIWSFEPLSVPLARLRQKAVLDNEWMSTHCALGDTTESITIHVAGNDGASSSVLPMLAAHVAAAPSSAYVGTELVSMRRLDDVIQDIGVLDLDRIFLKIDVQGYEGSVLDGAAQLLRSSRLVGLQMELSFTPLYENATDWREGFDRAAKLGMNLVSLDPGFTDSGGRMLQADAVFMRD